MTAPPPPPHPSKLPYGTVLVAGLGTSTVIADMDFETYSEAGFVWSEAEQKWAALPGAAQGKRGIKIVGMAAYAMHPSTEVLTLSYNLKDGRGVRRWRPGLPLPTDLFDHVAAGKLIEAWNAGFEWWIWSEVCAKRYGWPPVPTTQFRCAQAKAQASGLPGKLAKAGAVLGLEVQKDKAGEALIKKFCVPRNPTKSNPSRRIRPEDDPEAFERLCAYCDTDIETEAEASSRIPDLAGEELAYWQADQAINRRGVYIDLPAVEDCIAIVEQATQRACAELQGLTGGRVAGPTKVGDTLAWLDRRGLDLTALDEDTVADALKRPLLPPDVRRVLEIRRDTASAAVKKLYAMRVRTAPNTSRAHDLFNYHATRTGRCTGADIQATNLPNSGEKVKRCESCGKTYGRSVVDCPYCGCDGAFAQSAEWGPGAAADAFEAVTARSLDYLEFVYGKGRALPVVSSMIRGQFRSRPGHKLIVGDYSAIEAVGLAMLAGEQWRIDVFNTHGKIYEMSAAKVTGVPFDEILAHKERTKEHHPLRKTVGKVTELACLSHHTQVLTNNGYKRIVDVTLNDTLWDGIEWVTHAGVVPKGIREVISLDGVKMTRDHKIICGNSWKEAGQLASSESMLYRARASGSENLPWSTANCSKTTSCASFAHVVPTPMKCTYITCFAEKVRAATSALKPRLQSIVKTSGNIPTSSRMMTTDADCLTESQRASGAATGRKTLRSRITADGAYKFLNRGVRTGLRSSLTLSGFLGGMTRHWSLTAPTSTAIMNRVISGSYQRERTSKTNDPFGKCSDASTNWSDVYDIAHAGPRNRFTIKTDAGHLIVHNCGYGGWISAMKAFGADAFMTEDQMKQSIIGWREASPSIPEFWGGQFRGKPWSTDRRPCFFGVEGAAIQALLSPGRWFDVRHGVAFMSQAGTLYCRLPSGRLLTYRDAKLHDRGRWDTILLSYWGWNTNPKNGPVGWIQIWTHGGKLTENIVQAACRDLLRHATLKLEAADYPLVLHVYDEIVVEVPEDFGSDGEFAALMADRPAWAADWPVRVGEDVFREVRYRK